MTGTSIIAPVDESAIQDVLECMRSARPIDADNPLRQLVWIHTQIESYGVLTSPVERDVALATALADLIADRMRQLRVMHRIPTDAGACREEALAALRRDFQQSNGELEAWSLLYHRYVKLELNLQVQDISTILGINTRQIHRRTTLGLRRLTEAVSQLEIEARRENHRLWLQLKIPAPASVKLFGNDQARDDLYEFLLETSPPRVTMLVGARGIGKTALAQMVVHKLSENERYEDFAWLDFDVQTAYMTVLQDLARELGYFHLANIGDANLEAGLRVRLASAPTLVVLDSADHIEELNDLLPRLERLVTPGHVLVISRHHPPVEFPVRVVQVQPLDLAGFSDLLLDAARRRRIPRKILLDDAMLKDLHTALGGNPLAGQLVIGQLSILPVSRVMENLSTLRTDRGETLLETMFGSVWESLDALSRQVAAAISLLPQKEATWDKILALADLSPGDLDVALEKLTTCSLVDASGDEPLYVLSPLARRFIREQRWEPSLSGLFHQHLRRAVDALQGDNTVTLPAYPVALLRDQAISADKHEVIELVVQLSPAIRRSGQWALWRDVLSQIAEHLRSSGGDPTNLALILLELGIAYRWLGKFSTARQLLSESITLFGEVGEFSRQSEALIEMGRLSQDMGDTDPAFEAFQRAAATAYRYGHPEIQRQALNGLVNLALHNNRVEQALELAQQVLETFGDDSPDGQTLSTYGIALMRAGAVDEAVNVQLQALDYYHTEGDIPGLSRTHLRLGMAYTTAGRYEDALDHFLEGLYLMESLGDALGRARILTNLGTVYAMQEKWDGARSTWEQAMGLQQNLNDRVGMAYTWYNLADMYWKAENKVDAQKALSQARLLAEQFNLLSLLGNINSHPLSLC